MEIEIFRTGGEFVKRIVPAIVLAYAAAACVTPPDKSSANTSSEVVLISTFNRTPTAESISMLSPTLARTTISSPTAIIKLETPIPYVVEQKLEYMPGQGVVVRRQWSDDRVELEKLQSPPTPMIRRPTPTPQPPRWSKPGIERQAEAQYQQDLEETLTLLGACGGKWFDYVDEPVDIIALGNVPVLEHESRPMRSYMLEKVVGGTVTRILALPGGDLSFIKNHPRLAAEIIFRTSNFRGNTPAQAKSNADRAIREIGQCLNNQQMITFRYF